MLPGSEIRLPGRVQESVDVQTSAASARMKVLLVTSFPPSRGDLNEYGFHLASSLRDNPCVELIVLADEIDDGREDDGRENDGRELDGFHVERCWRFNSSLNVLRLLSKIRQHKPDVVWFNIGFSTFARNPIAAFLALTLPALVRFSGYYTHITLHTIFERIDLKDAGIRWPGLYRTAGRAGTRLLLLANDVSVLLPSFRDDLLRNYGKQARRVQFRPHGTFEGIREGTRSSAQPLLNNNFNNGKDERIILAFGYWGTYKRIDLLLEAMDGIVQRVPNAMLVVAGTNHPSTPGYLESLQKQWAGRACVRFLGYVPETELPSLFRSASVLALPYSSAAGTSGVMHQACQYGLPMVAAAIPEIVEIAKEEKVAVEFYLPGDRKVLARKMIRLLSSDQLHRAASEQNLRAAGMTPMSQVTSGYLQLFAERVRKFNPQGTNHEVCRRSQN